MAKSHKISEKDRIIIKELKDNPSGLRAKNIQKLTKINNRTLYNHLEKLKKLKIVENIFPIWRLCHFESKSQNMANLLKSNKIELHDISYIIRLIRKPDWWEKRENRMIKLKEFQIKNIKWGNNPYQQLMNDNFFIQIHSNSILFMSKKKYYGCDSYDCFIQATNDFLDIYKYLEQRFNFKFFLDGIPQVSIRSQHYVNLNDEIAKKCKKEGNWLRGEIDGKLRFWVDASDPLGLEFGHKNYAPEDIRIWKRHIADVVKYNPPTNSELSKFQAETTQNLNKTVMVMQNVLEQQKSLPVVLNKLEQQITSHLKLIREYRKENIKWRKGKIKELKKGINQTKLDNFI